MQNSNQKAAISMLLGTMGSGKSSLMVAICRRLRYSNILLVSPSYYEEQALWKGLPVTHIPPADIADIMKTIVERRVEYVEDCVEQGKTPVKIALVIDDCAYFAKSRTTELNSLVIRSRHLYIDLYISSQHVNAFTPAIRNNVSNLYMGKMPENALAGVVKEFFMKSNYQKVEVAFRKVNEAFAQGARIFLYRNSDGEISYTSIDSVLGR